jgi:hypothetical protein
MFQLFIVLDSGKSDWLVDDGWGMKPLSTVIHPWNSTVNMKESKQQSQVSENVRLHEKQVEYERQQQVSKARPHSHKTRSHFVSFMHSQNLMTI